MSLRQFLTDAGVLPDKRLPVDAQRLVNRLVDRCKLDPIELQELADILRRANVPVEV